MTNKFINLTYIVMGVTLFCIGHVQAEPVSPLPPLAKGGKAPGFQKLPVYGPLHQQSSEIYSYDDKESQGISIRYTRGGGRVTFCIPNEHFETPSFVNYRINIPYGKCKLLVNGMSKELEEGTYQNWFPLSNEYGSNIIQIQGLIRNTRVQIEALQGMRAVLPAPEFSLQSGEEAFENAGFEHGDLTSWNASGEAFEFQPTYKDNIGFRMEPLGAFPVDTYWVGTFEKRDSVWNKPGSILGDKATGELISDPFVINKRYLSGLVGGGNHADTSVIILEDGYELARFTGKNEEVLSPFVLDLKNYQGKRCQIKIIDHSSGSWGHVNVDNFVMFGEVGE